MKVQVITPKNLSEQQVQAMREFAKASGIEVSEQETNIFDKVKDAFKSEGKKKRK